MSSAAIDEAALALRPRLLGIAYRMLGSMSDAEDVVQDALLRARRAAPAELRSADAYLVATTSRVAIDHLRSARVRRETYVGPWLPEPLVGEVVADGADEVELADSISMAFLVVLEALSPSERAVLILHDVFGYSHREVARVLDRSEGASRQLLRRARQRVAQDRNEATVSQAQHRRVVERFMAACDGGSVDEFLDLLTDDATLVSDGGGGAKAARRPIVGQARIARFLAAVLPRGPLPHEHRIVTLNGAPALAILHAGSLVTAVSVEPADGGRIRTLWLLRNPDKLRRVRAAVEPPDVGIPG